MTDFTLTIGLGSWILLLLSSDKFHSDDRSGLLNSPIVKHAVTDFTLTIGRCSWIHLSFRQRQILFWRLVGAPGLTYCFGWSRFYSDDRSVLLDSPIVWQWQISLWRLVGASWIHLSFGGRLPPLRGCSWRTLRLLNWKRWMTVSCEHLSLQSARLQRRNKLCSC